MSFEIGDRVKTSFGEYGTIVRKAKYKGDCQYHDYLVEIDANLANGEKIRINEGYSESELESVN